MHNDIRPGRGKKTIPVQAAPQETPDDRLDNNNFKTPEQVAMDDKHNATDSTVNKPVVDPRTKSKPTIRERLASLTKKQKIIIVVVVILLLGGGGTAAALTGHKATPKPVAKIQTPAPAAAPAPTTVPNELTGLPVVPDVNTRPVTGVMIENSPDARPQSGLDQAGIVFEAVAEGGITRFLTLFQDTQPDYLGPVRSARPYYLQWCLSFNCALAHVGGSPEALTDISSWHVKDLDQFYNSAAYHRISTRVAPHNAYTSMSALNSLETAKGYGGPVAFTPFLRKPDAPAKTPTATSIDLAISSADYNSHFQYDAAANSYKRNEGGVPHNQVDGAGKPTQIEPKVLVTMIMAQGLEPDDHHTSYGALGTGAATFFQDGLVATGAWHKADNNAPLTFTDANGNPEKFNAGQTWLTVLGDPSYLSYKP